MAEIHGSAGAATCFKGDQLMSQAIVPMLSMGVLTYFLFRAGSSLTQPVRVSVVCLAVLLGYQCIHDVFLLEAAAGQYYGGAVGERGVGQVLSCLPSGFHVFNGIRFPSGDVDHVVVGPTGVFSIETKNYSGTIGVREGHIIRNGELLAHDPIRQSRLEARYVASLTGPLPGVPHVVPVVVFARAKVRAHGTVGGVAVVGIEALLDVILSGAPQLPQAAVDEVARLMEVKIRLRAVEPLYRRGRLAIWGWPGEPVGLLRPGSLRIVHWRGRPSRAMGRTPVRQGP
ncbi:MAG TPA: nuclease-related domain-containing protein [Candidatus Cryosericum sp.]|nr:nuclease-related domain-containing protein [Candidatus Cryosericum sp.]